MTKIITGNDTYGYIDYKTNVTSGDDQILELDIGHDIRTYTVVHDGQTQTVKDFYVTIKSNFFLQVFVMEVVGTAIFVSVYMSIKYYTPSKESILGAFTVALTLYGIIMTIGDKTGGCLNPAMGLV